MSDESERKAALRTTLRAGRRARTATARAAAETALTAHVLALPEVGTARAVALYVAGPSEPPTADLLAALVARGTRVLLPVVRPDLDLEWAWYTGALEPARDTTMALLEPTGERLGLSAVGDVDVVLAPGLAVGADGSRLGQGGGSYDRALTRVPAHVPVVVLLFDDELLETVPTEPHDRPVTAVVTPERVLRFGPRNI